MPSEIQPITARASSAVTKSDTTIHTPPYDALYVGGAGDVAIRDLRGAVTTFVGVLAGSILPISCDRVMSTNTTATSILGLRYG